MIDRDRHRGRLLGLAAGDALGTTVEFRQRGTFEPLTRIIGGGPFRLRPGESTDDTSMALCLAASLVECGAPIAGPTYPMSAGNGCIMRLAPVPMFFAADERAARHYAAESSRTTHGADECLDACRLFAGMLCRALRGAPKDAVLSGDAGTFAGAPAIPAIAEGDYQDLTANHIRGSGYVVDSLRAALWCFARTDRYEAAVLEAANLGEDADTTAAVCGQLAGAFYGERGIPAHWLKILAKREEIAGLADRLADGPRT